MNKFIFPRVPHSKAHIHMGFSTGFVKYFELLFGFNTNLFLGLKKAETFFFSYLSTSSRLLTFFQQFPRYHLLCLGSVASYYFCIVVVFSSFNFCCCCYRCWFLCSVVVVITGHEAVSVH